VLRWAAIGHAGADVRAAVIAKHGGPGVLELQARPVPELGAAQVRLDVAAAGVNFADVLARIGLCPHGPKPPCVIGYEIAGTILELGAGAAHTMIAERRNIGKVVLVP